MKIFFVTFVATIAFQGISAAPLLAPLWSIAPLTTIDGPAAQAWSVKNTALLDHVKGPFFQGAFILNEAALTRVDDDFTQVAPINAAALCSSGKDTTQIGLVNALAVSDSDGKITQKGPVNLNILNTADEYNADGILSVSVGSKGRPNDVKGLHLDLLSRN